jgi:hypothetical protein
MSADGQRRATNAQVERRAGNQAVYRMVNNRILDVNDAFGEWDHAEFLCECGTAGCQVKLQVSGHEYSAIRAKATRFVTAVGHFDPIVDLVVEKGDRYWIVEAVPGLPTKIATETAEQSP